MKYFAKITFKDQFTEVSHLINAHPASVKLFLI